MLMLLIRKVLFFAAYLVSLYLIGWTIAYVLAMGVDFQYYFYYLYLVWIAGAGEIPNIIQVLAFIVTFILLLSTPIVWLVVRRYRDRQ